MSGQVDIIISKKALAEIEKAQLELTKLQKKMLEINRLGSKSKGVANNQNLTKEIAEIKKLIGANKELTATKKKAIKTIQGTARAYNEQIKKLRKQQEELSTTNRSYRQFEMRIMGVKHKLKQLTKTYSQVSIAKRKAGKATGGLIGKFGKLGKVIKGVGLIFLLMQLKDLAIQMVRNFFELAKTFDSLGFALERTSKNLEEARMNTMFMLKLSSDLGLSLIATTTRFIKFAAAARNSGLAMKDVQSIFGTMAKAGAVLGLRTDELSGVFLALEQMLSKGKVTTEELRRQLGERLPGAFGIMAASLGVTLPKLDEMLKKGELLSADVLPGFARAVEAAFGLETVDKVETLTASQNRLTTSWQNFVKYLTGEGSVIRSFFAGILDYSTKFVNGINELFNRQEVADASNLEKGFDKQTEAIKKAAKEAVDLTRKNGKKLADLDAEVTRTAALADGKLQNDVTDEKIRIAVQNKLKFTNEVEAMQQKIAEKEFAAAYVNYQKEKKIVEEQQAELAQIKLDILNPELSAQRTKLGKKEGAAIDILTAALERLNLAEGKYSATRLQAEKSVPVEVTPKPKRGTKSISDISDLTNRVNAERLQTEIDYNKSLIDVMEKGDSKILELQETNRQKQLLIQVHFDDDAIAKIKKNSLDKIAESDQYLKDKLITQEEHDRRLIQIEKNKTDDLEIIRQEFIQKEISVNSGFSKARLQQEKDLTDNLEIAESARLAREIDKLELHYEGLELITKDKEKLAKRFNLEKKQLENDSFDATVDLQIQEIKNLANLGGAQENYTKLIQDRIDVLEGTKKGKVGEPITKGLTDEEQLDLDLEYLGRFTDAAGDLVSTLFDRKIAAIDAEIEAEARKYALLYAFAEGDADQTRALKIQEEKDRQILEEKKRKLEKKQAIADKASAIIAIAINTAVAISKALAQGGFIFGLPAVPVIAGLGALQIATVLAQPIPEFAEGGTMKKDGVALVGDGGKQEVLKSPDGSLSLTPDKDTLMNLQKGTKIFSSVDKFNQENPEDMTSLLHSSNLLNSISLNQKNLDGMMIAQKQLDERLLEAMILNTKAVKNSKSSLNVSTQKIDIPHEIWKANFLN
jgi:tape measure domain-containing protein